MIDLGIPEILWSAMLVVAAIAVTLWWKIPVQKDMAIGSVRTFIQLIAVGYALKYIFDLHEEDIYCCAADIGWVAPVAGTITEVGLGMNSAASSALDINVNGVSQTSLPVTLSKHTFSISVPFVAGDVITVNNDALGSQLNNTILNMMIEV